MARRCSGAADGEDATGGAGRRRVVAASTGRHRQARVGFGSPEADQSRSGRGSRGPGLDRWRRSFLCLARRVDSAERLRQPCGRRQCCSGAGRELQPRAPRWSTSDEKRALRLGDPSEATSCLIAWVMSGRFAAQLGRGTAKSHAERHDVDGFGVLGQRYQRMDGGRDRLRPGAGPAPTWRDRPPDSAPAARRGWREMRRSPIGRGLLRRSGSRYRTSARSPAFTSKSAARAAAQPRHDQYSLSARRTREASYVPTSAKCNDLQ